MGYEAGKSGGLRIDVGHLGMLNVPQRLNAHGANYTVDKSHEFNQKEGAVEKEFLIYLEVRDSVANKW